METSPNQSLYHNGWSLDQVYPSEQMSSSSSDSDSEWTKDKSPPKRLRKVSGDEDSRKSKNSSTFIHKVFEMANCKRHAHAIGFSEDGHSLEIRNGSLLGPVLSQYFRHGHTSSFIRQLNNYGFKTISSPSSGNDRHVFAHPNFKRDDRVLLESITRKAAMREKKKSKADVIKELQQREVEQRSRLIQLEARHHELMQRTMMLDAENRNLKNMFQTLKAAEKLDFGAVPQLSDSSYDLSPRRAFGNGNPYDRIASPFGSAHGTNPNSPVFTDNLHQLHQVQLHMEHLNMDIVMSPMASNTPDDSEHEGMMDHHGSLDYETLDHANSTVPQA